MQSDQRAERSASSLNRELIRAIARIAAMPGDHESAVPEATRLKVSKTALYTALQSTSAADS